MEDELHPLTELILKRMESHPEEFEQQLEGRENHRIYPANIGRWDIALNTIKHHGSRADDEAVLAAISKIRMDEAHRWAMDELLNGPARREAERRKHEEEVKLHRQMAQQAAQAVPQSYVNSLQSASSLENALRAGTASPTTTGTGLLGTLRKGLGI